MTVFELRMKYHQDTGIAIPKNLTKEYTTWLESLITGESLVEELPVKELEEIQSLKEEIDRLDSEVSELERKIQELT